MAKAGGPFFRVVNEEEEDLKFDGERARSDTNVTDYDGSMEI